VWGENNGFDDVWLSEYHVINDDYLRSILPAAAAIAARTNRIHFAAGMLLSLGGKMVRYAHTMLFLLKK
jgi:alkanesulfonate monooxygenase SsuD/methylene tetrahydromethanopterin reductase-like flavin-dependent oxidoreductase (luciferase family)